MGVGFYTDSVGDDGTPWSAHRAQNPPFDRMTAGGHRFIRGNHDNPAVCRRHKRWIPDGLVESIGDSTVMFIGGAWSIDRDSRIEGRDWWADEEVGELEFRMLFDVYRATQPDVVVTHDCPSAIAIELFLGEHRVSYKSRTAGWLQAMYEEHRPEKWLFGHWHMSRDVIIGRCRFICLAELETMDIEL